MPVLAAPHRTDADHIPYAEVSRKFRRTNFDHDDWVYHRRSDRFLSNLSKIFTSGVVRQMSAEISLVASIALGACLWNALLVTGYQDYAGDLHAPLISNVPLVSLPLEPFTLSTPALGLLLVFRTNASYGRWLEARALWGSIVNHSRNILRLAAGWVPPDNEEQMEVLADAVWAFARSLQRHLLGPTDEDSFRLDIQGSLSPDLARNLLASRHRPTRALFEVTRLVDELPLQYMRRNEVDKSIVALTEVMGGCERIFSSPVPLVYTRHTARFLGFWILGLPLGMWRAFGMSWNHLELVPASILISFFFFGIEELAVQLEEPFSILPLEQMVTNIRLSVDEHVEWYTTASSDVRHISSSATFPGNRSYVDADFPMGQDTWESNEGAI